VQRGGLVEIHTGPRCRRLEGELIKVQRRQLLRDPILFGRDCQMAQVGRGCNRVLGRVVQTGIEEVPHAMHFQKLATKPTTRSRQNAWQVLRILIVRRYSMFMHWIWPAHQTGKTDTKLKVLDETVAR